MKKELIAELFGKFESACYSYEGIECWSARELQTIFNYSEWRNFLNVTDKAKVACKAAGEDTSHHFVDINKMMRFRKERINNSMSKLFEPLSPVFRL